MIVYVLVIQVKIVFSVINNFNERLIFVANKKLHVFPKNISDSYHVFKLIIIYYKYTTQSFETHHKIQNFVLCNMKIVVMKKKTFSGRIIFTHIHLSNDNRRLRCLRIISTGLRSLSFQSIHCT